MRANHIQTRAREQTYKKKWHPATPTTVSSFLFKRNSKGWRLNGCLSVLCPPCDKNSCGIVNDKEAAICRGAGPNCEHPVPNLHGEWTYVTSGRILGANADLHVAAGCVCAALYCHHVRLCPCSDDPLWKLLSTCGCDHACVSGQLPPQF